MNRKWAITIGVALALVAAGYFGLQATRREARAVDNGVVEFKKGNYESAVRMLTPYADHGNRAAEISVGTAYAYGLGIGRDHQRAHALLQRALGARASEMDLSIAKSFETGDGVAKDVQEAKWWYQIAADEGSTEARAHLKNTPG